MVSNRWQEVWLQSKGLLKRPTDSSTLIDNIKIYSDSAQTNEITDAVSSIIDITSSGQLRFGLSESALSNASVSIGDIVYIKFDGTDGDLKAVMTALSVILMARLHTKVAFSRGTQLLEQHQLLFHKSPRTQVAKKYGSYLIAHRSTPISIVQESPIISKFTKTPATQMK